MLFVFVTVLFPNDSSSVAYFTRVLDAGVLFVRLKGFGSSSLSFGKLFLLTASPNSMSRRFWLGGEVGDFFSGLIRLFPFNIFTLLCGLFPLAWSTWFSL